MELVGKYRLTAGPREIRLRSMAFAELHIAPRTKGRGVKQVRLEPAGDLVPADLALLASERGIKPTAIKELRERHHALARCLAGGMKDVECSAITGYSPSRISILKSDPTFQALIEDYKSLNAGVAADFVQRSQTLAISVIDRLQEAVDDDEKPLSVPTLLEVGKFTADRTGNGPSTKTQSVNVNVNLGDRLRSARERANAAMRVPLLDITPRPPPD